ncbi:V-type ATPase subunit subunit G family protein [uncultured Methanoregula sp.]|uniref:V-type ATPase subunit subunit G family protein n=1 Tax=uncultured Methanoregula sp. TaxID=1005933 RepID=UPI002AAB8CCD|nr:V-type ATPase subunit subunit G family protein [uncultured Methanoregula sp.]
MTDSDKTLLQQIREKEQELAQRVDRARVESEEAVDAAKAEAEDLICTADKAGKVTAEQVYWKERGRTETEIEELKRTAELERETTSLQGERNVPAAVERIVRYVTRE